MRWLNAEYILKGLFLGLVFYAALYQAELSPDSAAWTRFAWLNLSAVAGLLIALVIAAAVKLREGFRGTGKPHLFVLFLLLESPWLVYLGVLAGTLFGLYWIHDPARGWDDPLLAPAVGGGAALGLVFGILRQVPRKLARLAYGLVMAAAVAGGVLFWLGQFGDFGQRPNLPYLNDGLDAQPLTQILFATQILAGVALFYVLTFAGREDETEVEIAAVCAGIAVALGVYSRTFLSPESREHVGYVLYLAPLILYLAYAGRALPWLRVVKHSFRGLSFARVGSHRRALQSFRRALQLDPNNKLAREGFWDVHRALDLNAIANDQLTLSLVDLDLCLDRAGSLLVQGKPTAAQLDEAHRLLDLVLRLRPQLQPPTDYWRAVAHTHARQYDEAAAELTRLIDPAPYGRDNPQRQAVLLPAWQLALTLSEELRKRVGLPQLTQPGRRMEAIAVVERRLSENKDDEAAWGLKRLLYSELTEAEYFQAIADQTPAAAGSGDPAAALLSGDPLTALFDHNYMQRLYRLAIEPQNQPAAAIPFDYNYVQQLGLALIDDDTRWQRGGEYLRIAAHGLPTQGPTLFLQIAQAQERAGKLEQARHNLELAKRAGRSVGAKNLGDAERQAYFAAVKHLAELAQAAGDADAAIENLHLYAESERSGLETLRTLADLYERKGDALMALRVTEQALVYNPKDKDLLGRKDRYYYSVMPDDLKARLEQIKGGFDFDYCLRRTRTILDGKQLTGAEWLDVASHLVQLALVVKPESLTAKVLYARVRLRYGERDEAIALLEQVRQPKPERFEGDDEEGWYQACQLLGDLYLEAGRPDLAVVCLTEFRKSAKSGARTLYKLGQAYEQLGDRPHAVKAYQMVTAYDGNPLVYDARSALHRLQTG
jgi:tetratricopeptide (TPR) repeat protein